MNKEIEKEEYEKHIDSVASELEEEYEKQKERWVCKCKKYRERK